MFKKFLYCSAILSITSLGSINNIYASDKPSEIYGNAFQKQSLQELLNNPDNTVIFNNNTISCNNKILDEDDYIHENNTIYIDMNTLPI